MCVCVYIYNMYNICISLFTISKILEKCALCIIKLHQRLKSVFNILKR